eukprot:1616655-Rhodomonas_salina.2
MPRGVRSTYKEKARKDWHLSPMLMLTPSTALRLAVPATATYNVSIASINASTDSRNGSSANRTASAAGINGTNDTINASNASIHGSTVTINRNVVAINGRAAGRNGGRLFSDLQPQHFLAPPSGTNTQTLSNAAAIPGTVVAVPATISSAPLHQYCCRYTTFSITG